MAKLTAPNGATIIGTLERIPGVARLDSISRDPETYELDFNYVGGTDVDWDLQETIERDGQVVFVDENGDEWLEGQLIEEASDDCNA